MLALVAIAKSIDCALLSIGSSLSAVGKSIEASISRLPVERVDFMFVESENVFYDTSYGPINAMYAVCDICGVKGPHGRDIDEAKSKAQKLGWFVKRGKVSEASRFVCSNHSNT